MYLKIFELTKDSSEANIDDCVQLFIKQMSFINAKSDAVHVRKGLIHGLENPDICKVFAAKNSDRKVVAAAFGNIGCSLEHAGLYYWINELYVDEEVRKKGVATSLLTHIIEWARKENFQGISLVSEFTNTTARQLYKKMHFKVGEVLIFDKNL